MLRMPGRVVFGLVLGILAVLFASQAGAAVIPAEAQRHFDRGTAAVGMASTTFDYESAVKEFEQAVRLAPDWADAYYNLGLVQEKVGNLDGALTSFRRYLQLAPGAPDGGTVKSMINKIEYMKEKKESYQTVYKKMQAVWHVKKQVSGEEGCSYTNYMKMNSVGRLVIDYPIKSNSEEINRITPDFFEVATNHNRYEYSVTLYRCTAQSSRELRAPTNCPIHINVKGEVISSNPARLREDVVVIDPWASRERECRGIVWEIND